MNQRRPEGGAAENAPARNWYAGDDVGIVYKKNPKGEPPRRNAPPRSQDDPVWYNSQSEGLANQDMFASILAIP